MSYDLDRIEDMPRAARAARILLFAGAGFTVLVVVEPLLEFQLSAELLGGLLWVAWPGVAAFVIALKMPHGGKRLYWAAIVVCAFWILGALGTLGHGNPLGITQLIIPISTLVLLTRRPSKDFFLAGGESGIV